jgi:hypothetical protein
MLVTIGQHFTRSVEMDVITCGEWEDMWAWEDVWDETRDFDDIRADERAAIDDQNEMLCKICDEVIRERQARIYQGRKTHGEIMVEAMLRYTKKHGWKVPAYWYPIAKKLKRKESCNTTKA